MRYKEAVRLFNMNVIVKGNAVSFDGDEDKALEQRASLLAKYTGTFEFENATIGVRMESFPKDNHLTLDWSVDAVRYSNGMLMAMSFKNTAPDELRAIAFVRELVSYIMQTDADIDQEFAKHNFSVYEA